MSNFQPALRKRLLDDSNITAVVGASGVYSFPAPQDAEYPYLIIGRVTGYEYQNLATVHGDVEVEQWQVDVWSDNEAQKDTLSRLVRNRLNQTDPNTWDNYGATGYYSIHRCHLDTRTTLNETADDASQRTFYRDVLTFDVTHSLDVTYYTALEITFDNPVSITPILSGGSSITWTSPTGSVSTGGSPSPAITEAGIWDVRAESLAAVTLLSLNSCTISAFDNLSEMTGATTLQCESNNLTALDTAGMTSLVYLRCKLNASLASLSVAESTLLESISAYSCAITSVDLTAITAITELDLHDNALTSVDLSNCTALAQAYLYDNPSLDVDGVVDDIYATKDSRVAMTVSIAGTCPTMSAGSVTKISELVSSYGHTWTYNT